MDARTRARDPAQPLQEPLEIDEEDLAHCPRRKRLARRMRDMLGCDGVNLLNSTGRRPGRPSSTCMCT